MKFCKDCEYASWCFYTETCREAFLAEFDGMNLARDKGRDKGPAPKAEPGKFKHWLDRLRRSRARARARTGLDI